MSRPSLVLLPGLSCDRAVWQPVIDRLPGIDCLVREVPARDRIGAMAEDLLADLPARFALAGHSLGGRMALEIVRRAADRVTHLALLDSGCRPRASGPAGITEREHRYALLAIAREQGMRAMGVRWTEPMVHPSRRTDRALMEAIVAMIARATPERFAAEIEALLARPDATDVLAGIRCPTLVAVGREDDWAGVEANREMADRITGCRFAVVEACGHMSPMERPDEVAALLLDLLQARTVAPVASRPLAALPAGR